MEIEEDEQTKGDTLDIEIPSWPSDYDLDSTITDIS